MNEWLRLQTEYAQSRIGPLILAEVERAVDMVTRRYPPAVYAAIYGRAGTWDDARQDLAQDVVTTILLGEGQLDYLMTTAESLDAFRALLYRQVRRLLARQRQRTVIDNLLDRVNDILGQPPFETISGNPDRYAFEEVPRDRPPSEDELHKAAVRVAAIPRVRFNVEERAPIVYDRKQLAAVVQVIASTLPVAFSRRDVDAILRAVLTDWIPSFLEEGDETIVPPDEEPTPEDRAVISDVVERVMQNTSAEQQLILLRKVEGISDGEVATEVGVSRPTLAVRKEEVFGLVEAELAGLAEGLQRGVMGELVIRLSAQAADEA